MLIAVIVVAVLLLIFGLSKTNIFAAMGGLVSAILIGGVGIALLGTAIAFPPFAIVLVIFFIIRGLTSK